MKKEKGIYYSQKSKTKDFKDLKSTKSAVKSKKDFQREEKSRRKEEKQNEKARKKAALEEIKNDKDDLYVLKKNWQFKIFRIILWLMISFVFAKGVTVSLRPDPTIKVNKTIDDFKVELTGFKEQDNELFSFAEKFAVEYFTYSGEQESDFVTRIKPYTSEKVSKEVYDFRNLNSSVLYAKAYRKEAYSKNQTDVFVWLTVEHKKQEKSEDGVVTTKVTREKTTVKIPIWFNNNRYIVEDFPAFVNDDIKASDFVQVKFIGTAVSPEIVDGITLSLNSFYKAYCEEQQNVIDYYLTSDAQKSNFVGLNGRVIFSKIKTMAAYLKTENVTNDFIVLATIEVIDKNGAALNQSFNLEMQFRDNMYYIKNMSTKTNNLK